MKASHTLVQVYKSGAIVYLVAMGPISINDSGECQEDIGMSPSTANFQRTGGVVHQYIQCLFIHYDLTEKKGHRDSEGTENVHTCIRLKIGLTLNCLSRWCASWQSLITKCSWESGTRELACFSRLHTSWNGEQEAQHNQECVSQHLNTLARIAHDSFSADRLCYDSHFHNLDLDLTAWLHVY